MHWDGTSTRWHSFGTRLDQFNLLPDCIDQFDRTHEHLGCQGLFRYTHPTPWSKSSATIQSTRNPRRLQGLTEFRRPPIRRRLCNRRDDPHQLLDPCSTCVPGLRRPYRPQSFVSDFGFAFGPIPRVFMRARVTRNSSEDVRHMEYCVRDGVVCNGG